VGLVHRVVEIYPLMSQMTMMCLRLKKIPFCGNVKLSYLKNSKQAKRKRKEYSGATQEMDEKTLFF